MNDRIKTFIWRFVRTALGVSLAQWFLLKPDFSNFKELGVVFAAAFIVALAKTLRDYCNENNKDTVLKYLPL
jgi:hypothetical protein